MRRHLVAVLLLGGCAPVYAPRVTHAPLLDSQGDTNISVLTGTQGWGAEVAHSPLPNFAVRASGQAKLLSSTYVLGTGGVGVYFASPAGWRNELWLDGGAGWAEAQTDVIINDVQSDVFHQARLFQGRVTFTTAYESPNAAGGLSIRYLDHYALHTQASDSSGTGTIRTFEPTFFGRFGAEQVKLHTYTGLIMPVDIRGDVGVPFPFMLGLGVSVDLDRVDPDPPSSESTTLETPR